MSTEQKKFNRLLIALDKFAQVDTLEKRCEILQQYPELYSEAADTMLNNLIHQKRKQNKKKEAQSLTLIRDILQKTRQHLSKKQNRENSEVPPQFTTDINRVNAILARYQQEGSVALLDETIVIWGQILNHVEFVHVNVAFRLKVLAGNANSYIQRYWLVDEVKDLEIAIAALQQAVDLHRQHFPDSSTLLKLLNNLGAGLDSYYNHTGKIEDLDRGIEAYQEAVVLTRQHLPNSSHLLILLNNLGIGLENRYTHTGQVEDLERGIEAYQEAVVIIRQHFPDFPNLPLYLSNLHDSLKIRHAHLGQSHDLERSIKAHQEAMAFIHKHFPKFSNLPDYLNSLNQEGRFRAHDMDRR